MSKGQSILPITEIKKDNFVLTLPSTDCINCKGMGASIINEIKNNGFENKIIILTNDAAGAYYLSNNNSIYGKLKTLVNESLCRKFAPNGSSTIGYETGDSIILVDLHLGLDSLLRKINNLLPLNPIFIDSTYVKYNIFSTYGNFIFEDSVSSLFLFTKSSNAGCYLTSNMNLDTSEILKTTFSTTKYDSFFHEFNCENSSDIPQKTLREFSINSGIPISKIYNITYSADNYYLLNSFLSGNADTITEIKRNDTTEQINQKIIYNFSIVKNNQKIVRNPLNISQYEVFFKIEKNINFQDNNFNFRNLAEFCISDEFIYLPYGKLKENYQCDDSIYYIAKFPINSINTKNPSSLLLYKTGNISEFCMLKSNGKNNPILVNKISKKMDFGEDSTPIDYSLLPIKKFEDDQIDILFDFYPKNENDIQIIAWTKNKRLITGRIINKNEVIDIKQLNIDTNPIYCQFHNGNKIFVVTTNENKIYTHQYKIR